MGNILYSTSEMRFFKATSLIALSSGAPSTEPCCEEFKMIRAPSRYEQCSLEIVCIYSHTDSYNGMMQYSCKNDPDSRATCTYFEEPGAMQYLETTDPNGDSETTDPTEGYFLTSSALFSSEQGGFKPNDQDADDFLNGGIVNWGSSAVPAGASCPSLNTADWPPRHNYSFECRRYADIEPPTLPPTSPPTEPPISPPAEQSSETCCEAFKVTTPPAGYSGCAIQIVCQHSHTDSESGMMQYGCQRIPSFLGCSVIADTGIAIQYLETAEDLREYGVGRYWFTTWIGMKTDDQTVEEFLSQPGTTWIDKSFVPAGLNCPSMNSEDWPYNYQSEYPGSLSFECLTNDQLNALLTPTDPCTSGEHNCGEATCVPIGQTHESYSCECDDGFYLTTDNVLIDSVWTDVKRCIDINECFQNVCGNARCYNTPGSYNCGESTTPAEQLTEMLAETRQLVELHDYDARSRLHRAVSRLTAKVERKSNERQATMARRGCVYDTNTYWRTELVRLFSIFSILKIKLRI